MADDTLPLFPRRQLRRSRQPLLAVCQRCRTIFSWIRCGIRQEAKYCSRRCYAAQRHDSFVERFWQNIEKTETCWPWRGNFRPNGYGRHEGFYEGSYQVLSAHRMSYVLHHGPIPEGLTIDHLCRNRACVNPAHLEVVSVGENILRGISPWAVNKAKTHCKYGHEFTEDNTRMDGAGNRACRICDHRRRQTANQRRILKHGNDAAALEPP